MAKSSSRAAHTATFAMADRVTADKILEAICAVSSALKKQPAFMEVCGTHTMAIAASGIRGLLPRSIKLLSGPGCPVCVTAPRDIDRLHHVAAQTGVILATFGDMVKVRGSCRSL
ncbi:MAG TPA: hypothetical protein PLL10_09510, partial [Elusimicrobiales bacterium]|nr:hypothetical protein [Elusimicrobiales bacterium]